MELEPPFISEECNQMLIEACEWLAGFSLQAAERFADEFSEMVLDILKMPSAAAPYENNRRRKKMKTFSYYIHYKEENGKVQILGLKHTSRNDALEM